jgi:glutaredoxin
MSVLCICFILCISCDALEESRDSGSRQAINQTQPVIIYGNADIGESDSLMKGLDEAGVEYSFKDIDSNDASAAEMWKKVDKAFWYTGHTVTLPVVDVSGEILEFPSLQRVIKRL